MRILFSIVLLLLAGCSSSRQLDDPFALTPDEKAKCAAVDVPQPSKTPFDGGDRAKRDAYIQAFSESYRYHKALGGWSSYCRNEDDSFYAAKLKGWHDGRELVKQKASATNVVVHPK